MTRDDKHKAEIVAAWAVVQHKWHENDFWRNIDVGFCLAALDEKPTLYRIKPPPRKFVIARYEDKTMFALDGMERAKLECPCAIEYIPVTEDEL